MLLKAIRVENYQGSVLIMPLEDISEGFVVKKVEGLGPVKATLVSAPFANQDGEEYYSSRREPRNILIHLGLEPDHAVESVGNLRSKLYDFFMPKTEVKLTFRVYDRYSTDHLTQEHDRNIVGRVESLEPDIFAKEPGVVLSVMCFDPDFVDPVEKVIEGLSTNGTTLWVDETYTGSVEAGFKFEMLLTRNVHEFSIRHQRPDGRLEIMTFGGTVQNGSLLDISTVRGDKYVKYHFGGNTFSYLYGMNVTSPWLELIPGLNRFRVSIAGTPPIAYTIKYNNRHGGL